MAYVDTPLANEDLDISQPLIRGNFQQADTSFGIDHYAFSNLTVNNGKHNKVTTPLIVGSAHPTTAAAELKFYAMQDAAEIGVIQYSRGPSDAVPTPVTSLQSPNTPIILINAATTPLLDCTNINRLFATVYGGNFSSSTSGTLFFVAEVMWDKSSTTFRTLSQASPTVPPGFGLTNAGSVLSIINATGTTLNNVYWTMHLNRVE